MTHLYPLHGETQVWSAMQAPDAQRLDLWEEQLCASHLSWALNEKPANNFDATLRFRFFNGYRIVNCASPNFSGFRSSQEISRTDGAYLALLYIKSGCERLKTGAMDAVLQAGDLVIWNSQESIDFRVLEPLEKVSIIMPEKTLTSVFPNAPDFTNIVVPGQNGIGATLASHVSTLCDQLDYLSTEALCSMMRPTMEMMAATFSNHRRLSPATMKHIGLNRVKQYIIQNLHDPDLTPTRIAQAHNISSRYLHMLFEGEGVTVGHWIRERRLERCKDDIFQSLVSRQSISDIAYRWGFSDQSHFSRAFKMHTGLSPRAYLNHVRERLSVSNH